MVGFRSSLSTAQKKLGVRETKYAVHSTVINDIAKQAKAFLLNITVG